MNTPYHWNILFETSPIFIYAKKQDSTITDEKL